MSLASIRKRVAAATPGPWKDNQDPELLDYWNIHRLGAREPIGGAECPQDAELISHAPTDLALLLAAAEALGSQQHYCPNVTTGLPLCVTCGVPYPCPARVALDALEAAE